MAVVKTPVVLRVASQVPQIERNVVSGDESLELKTK